MLLRTTVTGSEQIARDQQAATLAHASLDRYGFQRSSTPVLARFIGTLELASADAWVVGVRVPEIDRSRGLRIPETTAPIGMGWRFGWDILGGPGRPTQRG